MTFKEQLIKIEACPDAIEWVGDRTLEQAWNECKRGDWMLWFAWHKVSKRKIVLAASLCTNEVRHLMKDERSTNAIAVGIRYGNGKATDEELKAAADDAYDAYAYADARAATAARAAACADAYAAARAAAAAARAAADDYPAGACAALTAAGAANARKETLAKCADICRQVLTDKVLKTEVS